MCICVLYGILVGVCSLMGVISKLYFNLLKKMLEFKKKKCCIVLYSKIVCLNICSCN